MAATALLTQDSSYQDYLDLEAGSVERHIFWDGEIFAIAGASIRHTTIETNLVVCLGAALQGRPCRPVVGNQRLRSPDSTRAVYADAAIVCGRPIAHPDDPDALTSPVVVFEVLSRSTEAFDRGDKFGYYRSFPSLMTVVLISQRSKYIERYHRDDNGVWSLAEYREADLLDLPAPGLSLSVQSLYEGIDALDAVG